MMHHKTHRAMIAPVASRTSALQLRSMIRTLETAGTLTPFEAERARGRV